MCEGWGRGEHWCGWGGGNGSGCGDGAGAVEVEEEGEEGCHQRVEDVEGGKGGDGAGVEG